MAKEADARPDMRHVLKQIGNVKLKATARYAHHSSHIIGAVLTRIIEAWFTFNGIPNVLRLNVLCFRFHQ